LTVELRDFGAETKSTGASLYVTTMFPSAVGILGEASLIDCRSLSHVTCESGGRLEEIGESAFSLSRVLTSSLIPSSVQMLGGSCFMRSDSLSVVRFESGSKLRSISESAFQICLPLRSICIPAAVTILGNRCFHACRSLDSVTFESGSRLEEICEDAFLMCSALTSILIPASVQRLGWQCFWDCKSLSDLKFESGSRLNLQHIGMSVFDKCSSLKSISLLDSFQPVDQDWYKSSFLTRLVFSSRDAVARISRRTLDDLISHFEICIPGNDGKPIPGYIFRAS
jgi:hypothetical protein